MNCWECQERIAAAARDQRTLSGVEDHLSRCGSCREFAIDMEAVAPALGDWSAPPSGVIDLDAVAAAVAGSMNAVPRSPAPTDRRGIVSRLADSPAALALGGAAALAAGIFASPAWLQQVAAGWLLGAALLVSFVILHFGRRTTVEGE